MYLKVLRAKIHRAVVTKAEADYVGSIAIDGELMDAVGIVPGECVLVADIDNGARFETYAVAGPRASGTICVNGAAAGLVSVGHKVIIIAFVLAGPEEVARHVARVALVDGKNRPLRVLETRTMP